MYESNILYLRAGARGPTAGLGRRGPGPHTGPWAPAPWAGTNLYRPGVPKTCACTKPLNCTRSLRKLGSRFHRCRAWKSNFCNYRVRVNILGMLIFGDMAIVHDIFLGGSGACRTRLSGQGCLSNPAAWPGLHIEILGSCTYIHQPGCINP